MELRESAQQRAFDNKDDYWMRDALCKDASPEVFFPLDASDREALKVAKAICELCSVKTECLSYAIETRQEHGIWGGESERERRKIIKQQMRRTAVPSS